MSRNTLARPEIFDIPLASCELEKVGPRGDGSYWLPTWWRELHALVSPGVGPEFGFDLDFSQEGSRTVLMLDPTVELPDLPVGMTHMPLWLGTTNTEDSWTLGQCLEQIEAMHPSARAMLQMDIEGAEWEILAAADSEWIARFEVVVVEFHDLDKFLDRRTSGHARTAIAKLREHFELVAIEATRGSLVLGPRRSSFPQTVETTWVSKKRLPTPETPDETVLP